MMAYNQIIAECALFHSKTDYDVYKWMPCIQGYTYMNYYVYLVGPMLTIKTPTYKISLTILKSCIIYVYLSIPSNISRTDQKKIYYEHIDILNIHNMDNETFLALLRDINNKLSEQIEI